MPGLLPKKENKMLKSLIVLSSICLLTTINPVIAQAEKKTDLKDLETKVLYSKKIVSQDIWFDYKRALFLSSTEKKPVLMSFCTEENSFCNKMYTNTFKDPKVKKYLQDHFISVKVDAQSNDRIQANKVMLEKDLVKEYEIDGYPSTTFLSPDGKTISGVTKGYISPDKFIVILKYIATESYKKKSLRDFERTNK